MGLTVPSFLGIVSIIAGSDYIAIVPEQLGKHFASGGNVKVLAVPFEIPSYQIMQHWHERYSQYPATRWFRHQMAEQFLVS